MGIQAIRYLTGVALFVMAAGCTSHSGQPSPGDQGWTQLGSVTVHAEQDRAALRAEHLPAKYKSICVEADGPVLVERLAASFTDTTTFLAEEQISFTGPDRRVIDMSAEEKQILHVMLVYSGGRPIRGTKITVWVR